MAKGLRASVKKNNRQILRKRVFAPVDDDRTARLSAKLLELAQQPRPARTEMEVDSEKGITAPKQERSLLAFKDINHTIDAASDEQTTANAAQAEGLSYHHACPISMLLSNVEGGSKGDGAGYSYYGSIDVPHQPSNAPVEEEDEINPALYHLLGLCTDMGFGEDGDLVMRFDSD
jgi:hypothetical protein